MKHEDWNFSSSYTYEVSNVKRSTYSSNYELILAMMDADDFTLQILQTDTETINKQFTIDHSYTNLDVLVRISSESEMIISCSHELSTTSGYSIYFDAVNTSTQTVTSFKDSDSAYCLQALDLVGASELGQFLLIDHDQNVRIADLNFDLGTMSARHSISPLEIVDAYNLGVDSAYAIMTPSDQWLFGTTSKLLE